MGRAGRGGGSRGGGSRGGGSRGGFSRSGGGRSRSGGGFRSSGFHFHRPPPHQDTITIVIGVVEGTMALVVLRRLLLLRQSYLCLASLY